MIRLVFALMFVVALANAQPEKSVWPIQFDTPFGLNTVVPPIHNATSHFYYNWDIQAQLIDYVDHCFPFAHWDSAFFPCKLYFNPSGVYVSAPKIDLDCCTLFAGVGAVPPNFLQGFNFSSTETADDMYGVQHNCNFWLGADDFGYWTDVDTRHDIQFRDGPSGVFWNFGHFNVVNQSEALFQLPSGDCSTKCGFLMKDDQLNPAADPFVSLSMTFAN